MIPWILALSALVAQEDEGLPRARGELELRQRIAELERKLAETDRKIREAAERDPEAARRLNREYQQTEHERAGLRKALEEERARSPRRPWYERVNLEAQGLLTHWDDDLEIEDGAGWGAAVYVRDLFFLEFRRWEREDELGDDDLTVSSATAGFTYEFGLEEDRTSAAVLSVSAGLIRFTSDAAGSDGDAGPILSASPQWKLTLSPALRLNVAGDVDLLRTDFNQRRTHTNHTFSLVASIELAF
jgi:hypothetical protein